VARDFTKNTSNYVTIPTNTIGNRLNGAAKISLHAIITGDTFSGVGANDNRWISVTINGSSTGLAMNIDAGTGGGNRVRLLARSGSGDTLQGLSSAGGVIAAGTEYALGGMVDIGGDTLSIYHNGSLSTGPTGVTFGNATYTQGTATQADGIGGDGSAPPGATTAQFDGRVSEVAIWNDDIGAAGFAMLHRRVSALFVKPDNLVWYSRLVEDAIIDMIGGTVATIVGTVAKADHPRMVYTGNSLVTMTGGAEAPPADITWLRVAR
jgi:hypothetical protein